MNNEKKYNARNIVLTILCRTLEDRVPSHIAVNDAFEKCPEMTKEDRSFVKLLSMGTVERIVILDNVINEFSKTATDRQKPIIRNILRMGVYQILYMNVPDSAACNEAVKLAKKRGLTGLSGFVNGVLRNVAAHRDNILEKYSGPASSDPIPEWIRNHYTERFGEQKASKAFEHFLAESRTQIRCNISRISPEMLAEKLKEEKIDVVMRRGPEAGRSNDPQVVSAAYERAASKSMIITGYDSIAGIAAFNEGLFAIQDFSSVMAGEVPVREDIAAYIEKHLSENNRPLEILDICAAPGGKTLNMADRLKKEGFGAHFTACDISGYKLDRIRENVKRCGFDNIDCVQSDGTVFEPEFEEAFDIVIADVPCSGLGVIGRKPDIMLNTTSEDIARLVTLQRKILDNAVRYLKKGGFIVFSTCTVGRAENEDNAEYIAGKGFECLCGEQICPGEYESDGFFYALLRRVQ